MLFLCIPCGLPYFTSSPWRWKTQVLCGICSSRFLIFLIRDEEAKPRARCNPWAAPAQRCALEAAALGGERSRRREAFRTFLAGPGTGRDSDPLCGAFVLRQFPWCSRFVCRPVCEAALLSITPHRLISRGGASLCRARAAEP